MQHERQRVASKARQISPARVGAIIAPATLGGPVIDASHP
jgi:hypothetical protein